MSTHRPARKSGNQEAAVFLARSARSTVKNGRQTTLIARKLAATTSVFVSHWEWGQILLIPGVLGLAVMSIVGLLFPKANTPGPETATKPCISFRSLLGTPSSPAVFGVLCCVCPRETEVS